MTDNNPHQDAWLAEAERLIDLYGCACRAWSQGDKDEADKDVGKHHSALLAHLRTRPASPAVPPGWKMVPIEPTQAMYEAWDFAAGYRYTRAAVWRDILDASPPAPAAQPVAWRWKYHRAQDFHAHTWNYTAVEQFANDARAAGWEVQALTSAGVAPAAQPDLAQKPTVTHLLRLAVAMRHAPSDGYDDAYKCLQNALYAALSVRPSNDIADDIPGSTAAGGGEGGDDAQA